MNKNGTLFGLKGRIRDLNQKKREYGPTLGPRVYLNLPNPAFFEVLN